MKSIQRLLSTSAFRLILIVVIMIIPINILTLVLSQTAIREVESKVSTQVEAALGLYMTQIDSAIERTTMKVHSVAINNIDFARLNVKEIDSNEEYYNQLQSVVNLKNTMADVVDENTWVTGVFSYFPDKDIQIVNNRYITYRNSLLEYIKNVAVKDNKENMKKWKIVKIGESNIIIFVDNYKNAYYGAWFDLQYLAKILGIRGEDNTWDLVFKDQYGDICYSNQGDLGQSNLSEIQEELGKDGAIIVGEESKYSKLSVVQILSKSEMKNNLPDMIRRLQLASIFALLILPIIILSIKKWMFNPLRKLTQAIQHIEDGDMEFRIIEEEIGSEFSQINKNFNHMMDQVNTLKINVYEEKLEKQQIKMRFLSQQIKPHFILNTMNIIYSYEDYEYPLIQKMILCISKYFRYIVNTDSDFVELWQEMEHIHNYFDIQEARYPETFNATVTYDEELRSCLIPPLLVQNFAENAIKHSLKIGSEIEIEISITAKPYKDGFMQIILADTGQGVSDEILEAIRTFQKTRIYQEELGVGIQNSIERLDVFYKGKGEIDITRQASHGTRIEMILPIYLRKEE